MKLLILGEINLDTVFRSSSKSFTSVFSYRSAIFESQLAAITPKKHIVKILKVNENIDFDTDFNAVLINFKTGAAKIAYDVADKFRKRGKIVILGGNHPSALPKEAKQHADAVLIGVVEKLWPMVVDNLEKGDLQPFYESKDYIDYPLLPSTADFVSSGFKLVSPIEATRGCPDRCDFCQFSNTPGGSKFYARPIEDVISEIKSIPQKILYFKDLSMTIKPAYTKEIFRNMKGLKKKFICHGNIDVLAHDEELVRLSHEAGCMEWIAGFESFSQQVLDNVHKKGNKVEDYPRVVKTIHKYNIAIDGTFVFGFDEDAVDVFESTLVNIDKLGLDAAIFAVLTPYPGTPLFRKLEAEGRILTHDWSKYNRKNVVFEPKNMTKKELEEGYRWITKQFNSPPFIAFRLIRSLRLGVYPCLTTFASNLGSIMASVNK